MTTYERRRNVDKEWFQQKLDERELSMRGLAKIMECDPSTVSLMIRGLRGMNMENAQKMASVFNCTTAEIYKRAGLPIEDEARTIKVSMRQEKDGSVYEIDADLQGTMTAPFDTPIGSFAVQVRTGELHDGWLLVIDGSKHKPDTCLGQFCLYSNNYGKLGTGVVRRGYQPGLFNITENITTTPKDVNDIDVVWCSPVRWIKPVSLV